jgi:hypothetical protein
MLRRGPGRASFPSRDDACSGDDRVSGSSSGVRPSPASNGGTDCTPAGLLPRPHRTMGSHRCTGPNAAGSATPPGVRQPNWNRPRARETGGLRSQIGRDSAGEKRDRARGPCYPRRRPEHLGLVKRHVFIVERRLLWPSEPSGRRDPESVPLAPAEPFVPAEAAPPLRRPAERGRPAAAGAAARRACSAAATDQRDRDDHASQRPTRSDHPLSTVPNPGCSTVAASYR